MLRNLLPKNTDFFNYFEQHSALPMETAKEFLALMDGGPGMAAIIPRIKALEHKADDLTHLCVEELHKTFITPIDRYDIHSLIKRMDDILDSMDSIAARIAFYEIGDIRPEAKESAQVLIRACDELGQAIKGLRNLKNSPAIIEHCVAIHRLEFDGDAILRRALGKLFKEEKDTILVIKWKEIYERLEKAIDRCDDVADIVEGLVIEGS